MNPHSEQHSVTGWFPDPTGQHHWRYFEGHWTDVISDDGQTGLSPMPDHAVPQATAQPPAADSIDIPTGPIPLTGPSGAAPGPADPTPTRRRGLITALTAIGVAVVVAVVVGIAVASSGGSGSDDQASTDTDITGDFCADFPANYGPIESAWQTAGTVAHDLSPSADRDHDVNQLSKAASLTRRLAREAPDTTDMFGDPLPSVLGNWADFFAAASTLAADDGSDYQKHSDLLGSAQAHESESTPSLLKQAMFPDPGLPASRSCR